MFEPIHGEYSIKLIGNIVYCDYSHGFNKAGVIAITEEMLRVAEPVKEWVMLQRPEPSAGITSDAIETMYRGYIKLQQSGCLGVGIVDNSIFVRAGNFPKDGPLTMPIHIHKDEKVLMAYLNDILRDNTLA